MRERGSQSYAIDVHVDGVTSGGGNYTPTSFKWNGAFEASFAHLTDTSTGELMQLAQSNQNVGTAILHETLQGTPTITLAMTDVRVAAVREDGDSSDPNGPSETVVLHFKTITYTFQSVLPNGQKNGPPVVLTLSK